MTAQLQPAPAEEPAGNDRDETVAELKAALKARSDRRWSVTPGRGSSWGWITVTAPPARRTDFGSMTGDDAAELARLFGVDYIHHQGLLIPARAASRRAYVAMAQGARRVQVLDPGYD